MAHQPSKFITYPTQLALSISDVCTGLSGKETEEKFRLVREESAKRWQCEEKAADIASRVVDLSDWLADVGFRQSEEDSLPLDIALNHLFNALQSIPCNGEEKLEKAGLKLGLSPEQAQEFASWIMGDGLFGERLVSS